MILAPDLLKTCAEVSRQNQSGFLPKYFYAELGSQLFDAICLLPEYYLTHAENEILQRYADEIVASVEGETTLLEMGSDSAKNQVSN